MNNTVTKEMVDENMKDVLVRTVEEFGKKVTYVSLRMKNGFTLRESTTCVDPANYDEEIGKQICLKRLEDKIWFLLGYQLQEQLYQSTNHLNATAYQMQSSDFRERFRAEYLQTEIRYDRLTLMCSKWDAGVLEFTPKCPRELFTKQLEGMKIYLDVLKERAKIEDINLKE